LGDTIGKARPSDKPLWVGSIKANIGHLEGASGLAGLTKALYILEKGLIPPQVWLEEVNPRIKTDEWNLAIPRELTPWPYEGLRRVSINSFGFGGANAHAVIDDAYHYMKKRGIKGHHNTETTEIDGPTSDKASDSGVSLSPPDTVSSTSDDWSLVYRKLSNSAPKLIVWSAHEQNGVQRISEAYENYLKSKVVNLLSTEEQVLVDRFSYTTSERRSILPWKSFAIGSSANEIIDSLSSVGKPIRSSRVPKLAFVFTGQGAQHFAMGRELLGYDLYADSVKDASLYLTSLGCTWSADSELLKDEATSQINDPAYSQPICTVVQVALVDLLKHWGIKPSAVVGHSSGEIAAAYAKGAITREDAWAIAYHRGRLSALLPTMSSAKGGMLAAGVGEEEAQEYVAKASKGEAVVACMNSPSSVTISGDLAAILEIEDMLKADGVFARQLKVETAYHSPHMNAISELYLQSLLHIKTLPEDTNGPKMFSSVTGGLIDNSSLGPAYWVSNMLNPVKFSVATKELIEHSDNRRKKRANAKPYVDIFVEVGPHGALQGPVKQILGAAKAECTTFSILSRGQDAAHSTLQSVGRLFQHGYPANIAAANMQRRDILSNRSVLPDLPPFPWNHTNKYWHESAVSYNYRFKKVPRKDLLGMLDNEGNSSEIRWRNFFRLSENPWIEDHSVHNTLLYPAAGMMVMAIEAAAQIADPAHPVDGYELRDVVVGNALIVPRDEDGVETMFHLRPRRTGTQNTDSSWHEFVIYSRPGKEAWSHNCTGLLKVRYKIEIENPVFRNEVELANSFHRERHQRALLESKTPETSKSFYDHQFGIGLQLGDTFRNLIEINKGNNQSACAIQIPDMASTMPKNFIHDHVIHPCTLDAIVQTLLPTVEGTVEKMKVAAIPTYIERLFVSSDLSSKPGDVLQTYSVAGYTGLKEAEASVYASTENWEKPLVVLERIRATRLSALTDMATMSESKANLRKIAGEFRWKEDIHNVNNDDIQALCQNSPLLTLTELAAHKNPAMRILEIGAKDGEKTQKVLAALAANDGETTPWYKSYVVTDADGSALNNLKEMFGAYSPYVDCKALDIGQDPVGQGFQEADYDYILVSGLSAAQYVDDVVANIRKLIKTRGKLVVSGSATPALTLQSWADKLQANGFTGVDCLWPTLPDQASSPFAFILSTVISDKTLPGDVLLIQSDNPTSEATKLAVKLTNTLQSSGVAVSTVGFNVVDGMDLGGKFCIMLAELEQPLLFSLAVDDFKTVRNIILNSAGLVWVTRGAAINCEDPSLALITGLSRTIRQEHLDVSFATLDLDASIPVDILENVDYILKTINEVAEVKGDREFAVRDGRMMVPRVHLDKGTNALLHSLSTERPAELAPFKQPGRALTLSIGVPGMLDTLLFKDHDIYARPLKAGEVEVEVKASGLNFMDIMVAMDQIQEPAVGLECSGIVSRVGSSVTKFKPGDRVMTWLLGGFSTFARNSESMFQPIPADMSFETAASLPMIYCTAYQALVETARLQSGEKVLIHAAAGGVGQAAVMIAKHIGAEIFATVGSQAKKDILIKTYAIPEDHIFSSRDLSFADGIMRSTDGKGVDVVLNSLAGEGLRKSWLCLAWFGRFVELGKKDISKFTHST
jgi:acyl transferase domain-containing protein/NADPH:quinone reductase-like Zn-dependent oxidoreductase